MSESKHSEEKSNINSIKSASISQLSKMLANRSLNTALASSLAARTGGDTVRKLYPFYTSRISHGMYEFDSKYLNLFDVNDDEHRFEWTDIHHKYEELLEGYLTEFCGDNMIEPSQLFADLAESQESGDKQAKILIKMILAQADFTTFVEMMKGRVSGNKSGVKASDCDDNNKRKHK